MLSSAMATATITSIIHNTRQLHKYDMSFNFTFLSFVLSDVHPSIGTSHSVPSIGTSHSFAFRYPPLPLLGVRNVALTDETTWRMIQLQLRIPNLSFIVDQHASP